jgi:hypothetical protein
VEYDRYPFQWNRELPGVRNIVEDLTNHTRIFPAHEIPGLKPLSKEMAEDFEINLKDLESTGS